MVFEGFPQFVIRIFVVGWGAELAGPFPRNGAQTYTEVYTVYYTVYYTV